MVVLALVAVVVVIEVIVRRGGQPVPRALAVVAAVLALTAAMLFVGRVLRLTGD